MEMLIACGVIKPFGCIVLRAGETPESVVSRHGEDCFWRVCDGYIEMWHYVE